MNEETATLLTSDRCGVPDIRDDEELDTKRRKRYTFAGKVQVIKRIIYKKKKKKL